MTRFVSRRGVGEGRSPEAGPAAAHLSRMFTQGPVDRRRLLGWLTVGGLGSSVLAACGGSGEVGLADEDVTRTTEVEGAPPEPTEVVEVAEGATPPAATGGDVAQAPAGGEITIEGFDIGWEYEGQRTAPGAPIDVTVAPGTTISLPNVGAAAHNFAVDALNIDVDMPVGETVTAEIPADAAAETYEFYCNIPGHKEAGMVGNLIVDANAAAPAAAEGGEESPATPAESQAAAAGGDAITISAFDIGWEYNGQRTAPNAPIDVPVAPGQTISLPNTGAAAHNFVVETLDNVVVDMPVGETVTYTVPADAAPGTYEFICNLPGHVAAGMVGNLIVGEAGAAPAAAQGAAASPAAESAGAGSPAADGGEVTIEGYDIGWEYEGQRTAPGAPIDVTVAAGTTISLPNVGAAAHNFAVDALNISVDMPVGETVTAEIPADTAPGTYEFYCNIPGHKEAGMVGNLIVQ